MLRNAVITGIGIILPQVQTMDDLWNLQANGGNRIEPLSDRIEGSRIDTRTIAARIPSRQSKKLDVFTKYALIATDEAIRDAGLELDDIDRDRCGVFVGNCFGGWQFTERELRNLYQNGPRSVSPFQATSWFPAAPQGQITIKYGLKGFSKTFMADRMSSLVSIAAAAKKVRDGELDVAIAGGTESTNTDMVRTGLEMVRDANGDSVDTSRFNLSEGSVFIIIEEEQAARRRNARIYARIAGYSSGNQPCAADVYPNDSNGRARVMREAIGNRPPEIVIADASGLSWSEKGESDAIGRIAPRAAIVRAKDAIGHAFGAEGALDVGLGCLMLHRQEMPPLSAAMIAQSPHRDTDSETEIHSILVNASAMGGGMASLVLEKGDIQ